MPQSASEAIIGVKGDRGKGVKVVGVEPLAQLKYTSLSSIWNKQIQSV